MIRTIISILFMVPLALQGVPSDTLSLIQCLDLSTGHMPFRAMERVSLEAGRQQEILAGKAWYPALSLNASASYQSEVTSIPFEFPGVVIPAPPQDQYNAYLELRQLLYDGGLNKARLEIDILSERIHRNEIEISRRTVREAAAELFFSIMLVRSQGKVLDLAGEVLKEQYRAAGALFDEGVIPRKSLLEMQAAVIAWEQQRDELRAAERQGLAALSILTGTTIDTGTVLISGDLPLPDKRVYLTPEMQSFELRELQLDATARLSSRKLLPRASVFGRAGIGRPGLNMLSDEFSEYWVAGAGLSWSPWDWGQSRTERSIAALRRDEVRANHDLYLNQLQVREGQLLEEILKYPSLISRADTLIQLREEIRIAAAAAMAEGTLTTGEYLADHNESIRAMLERSRYDIEADKALVRYLLLTGQF